MFREMGDRSARAIARHAPAYAKWLRPRLRSADAVAWVVERPRGTPVGSGAVWFQPGHPRPGFDDLRSPYILSVYTVPDARGMGVATRVVREAVALARRLGYARVTLHSSVMGRGVYERLGFHSTTEMRLWIDPVQRRRDERRRAAEAKAGKGHR
jgi:GNAT superfamily N-acetyltransferase